MRLYRKSSPRTGRAYDSKVVNKGDVKYYLSKGWLKQPPSQKPKKEKIRSLDDITDEEILKIKDTKGSIAKVAKAFNVTMYTVRKIRAHKWDGQKDNW